MTQSSNTKSLTQGYITLDPHTAGFFSVEYHSGRIEKFFSLHYGGEPERRFAARKATLLTGERVVVAQEFHVGQEDAIVRAGAVFVGGDQFQWSFLPVDDSVRQFWLHVLAGSQASPDQRQAYPLFSASIWDLSRCHVPPHCGFGLQFVIDRWCELVDLHQNSRNPQYNPFPHLSLDRMFASTDRVRSPDSDAWMDLPDAQFHERIDTMLRAPSSALYQFLRFYTQSDDQRAREVFGCDMATVQRVMELCDLALKCEMSEAGPLAAYDCLFFCPFTTHGTLGYEDTYYKWPVTVAMPSGLRQRRRQILRRFKCHLASRPSSLQVTNYWARKLGREWAAKFTCVSEVPDSMHEVVTAISLLDEALAA